MTTRLSIEAAERLVAEAMQRAGTGPAQAASVARALVAAEAAGQGGHGLRRVAAYAAQAKAGKVDGFAAPTTERVRPGVLAVDAAHGFAFPAFDLVAGQLPALACETGIACAAVRRSHHAGVLALTVERFAQEGLVALMVANAPGAMAAWGGTRPLFGTNPIAFAAPLEGADPLVIDLSLSKIARGKVMAARQKGVPLPEGWALDRDGNPTTDPDAAMAGTMVPAGDAKGAALALMVEVLAAGLTGANFAYEASSLFDDVGDPPGLGQFVVAIDPVAIGGPGTLRRLAGLAREIAADPGTRVPGRRGIEARRLAAETGLAVEDDVMAAIAAV
ncbi:Ldh family oxidoreductase [Jiella endophytica]|uniref:Ldh family oxidoreductase n=1 Tax=Jiella endophytica TaxID=2558362 RepID=A0A4Y8RIC6_9HYPH|nr:Ldh family oxidoreductase [Jiella endophytica]TFF21890.1 Ldh family oxidoreductase [Jiella endophytica]